MMVIIMIGCLDVRAPEAEADVLPGPLQAIDIISLSLYIYIYIYACMYTYIYIYT